MSVAISWAKKVQLAKCDILVGFPKSSYIFLCMHRPVTEKNGLGAGPILVIKSGPA